MAMNEEKSRVDIEAGPHRTPTSNESDQSLCFSDAENRSWHSPFNSNSGEIDGIDEPRRNSCISSDCSFEDDLEYGAIRELEPEKNERNCRICYLSLESRELGAAIMLGCSCKDELGAAHKQCAETWFKMKGNKTCEICGSTAKNVVGVGDIELIEQANDTSNNNNNNNNTVTHAPATEARSIWQGHRLLNFLLACMIFAFVISWLFHFNVPS